MKVSLISAMMGVLLVAQGCQSEIPQMQPVDSPRPVERTTATGISKDQAIEIANKVALKTNDSLANFDIVACEQSIFWAIIYDGDNSEYLIDKLSGRIVQIRKVPQGHPSSTGRPQRINGITEQDAIEIAKDDFRSTYGRDSDANLLVISCELASVWRIVFDVKLMQGPNPYRPSIPDSHAPTYIIDKRTREVLYRQLY